MFELEERCPLCGERFIVELDINDIHDVTLCPHCKAKLKFKLVFLLMWDDDEDVSH